MSKVWNVNRVYLIICISVNQNVLVYVVIQAIKDLSTASLCSKMKGTQMKTIGLKIDQIDQHFWHFKIILTKKEIHNFSFFGHNYKIR